MKIYLKQYISNKPRGKILSAVKNCFVKNFCEKKIENCLRAEIPWVSYNCRQLLISLLLNKKEKLVKTETLENVLASHAKDLPVVIKLDTQGTELEILHGGIKRLQDHQVVGVEMEAPLLATPVMKGSGRFWEANRDLESWGYELLEIKPYSCATINKTSNQIGKRTAWECDAVFALRRDVAQDLPETFRRMLVFFYLAYEFYEEALSFLEQDSQVSESLTDLIKTSPIDVLKKTLELQE